MKALVLAGGSGTRLRPLSHSIPKQLLPVAGKSVLVHCLQNIRSAGIRDVAIVVGPRADEIRAAVDAAELDLRVTFLTQDAPRGLAHCVQLARDFLGVDDFVMYLGDNVVAEGIGELTGRFLASGAAAQLTVVKTPNPQEYGVAELGTDNRVTALVEKPARPASDLAVAGVYFLTSAIHRAVDSIEPSDRGELEITDALQWLIDRDLDVRAELFTGYWKDTGRVEDLLECNRVLLDQVEPAVPALLRRGVTGRVALGPDVRLVNSRIIGPAVIGAGTVIVDSEVGPHVSVGAGCRLVRARIADSIVLDDVRVTAVDGLHGSLIGRSAEVTGPSDARRRVIVGDHSRVEVG
jgi:glucose-1-phosphate thymidylyltransferase